MKFNREEFITLLFSIKPLFSSYLVKRGRLLNQCSMLARLRISIINYFLKYSRFLKITKIHQLGNFPYI